MKFLLCLQPKEKQELSIKIAETLKEHVAHFMPLLVNERGANKAAAELAGMMKETCQVSVNANSMKLIVSNGINKGKDKEIESMKEAKTGGSVESGNDSKPVDAVGEMWLQVVHAMDAEKKNPSGARHSGKYKQPVSTPLPDSTAPVGGVKSGEEIREEGTQVINQRKRQLTEDGITSGEHRTPKREQNAAMTSLFAASNVAFQVV